MTMVASALRSFWQSVREMSAETAALLWSWRWRLIVVALALVTLALITVTYDAVWLAWVRANNPRWVKSLARGLSFWGDFPTGTLILVALVAAVGFWRKSARLRHAALACLLAATVAGLGANLVRSAVGRPRPMAQLPDGAYGPTLEYRLLGFPSAHAATSFGTGAALAVTVPPLGAVALVGAGGVAWSRMVLNRHNPTDVTIGGSLGLLMGVAFGVTARRRTKRLGVRAEVSSPKA